MSNGATITATFKSNTAQFEKGVKKVQKQSDGLAKTFKKLASAMAFTAVAKTIVQSAAAYETLNLQLKQVYGSATAGAAAFAEVSRIATKTPFQLSELVQANKTLKQFGATMFTTGKGFKSMADLAAFANRSIADVSLIVGKFQMKLSSGENINESLNQMMEGGLVDAKTGLAMKGDPAKAMEIFIKYLQSIEGAAAEQSSTLNGAWSTLKDNLINLAAVIGTAVIPALTEIVKKASAFVGSQLINKDGSFNTWGAAKWIAIIAAGVGAAQAGGKMLAKAGKVLGLKAIGGVVKSKSASIIKDLAALGPTGFAKASKTAKQLGAGFPGKANYGGYVKFGMKRLFGSLTTGLLGQVGAIVTAAAVGWEIGTYLSELGPVKDMSDRVSNWLDSDNASIREDAAKPVGGEIGEYLKRRRAEGLKLEKEQLEYDKKKTAILKAQTEARERYLAAENKMQKAAQEIQLRKNRVAGRELNLNRLQRLAKYDKMTDPQKAAVLKSGYNKGRNKIALAAGIDPNSSTKDLREMVKNGEVHQREAAMSLLEGLFKYNALISSLTLTTAKKSGPIINQVTPDATQYHSLTKVGGAAGYKPKTLSIAEKSLKVLEDIKSNTSDMSANQMVMD